MQEIISYTTDVSKNLPDLLWKTWYYLSKYNKSSYVKIIATEMPKCVYERLCEYWE
jgi:hypothetical protein